MKCAKIDKCGLESTKSRESNALEREIASKKLKRAVIFCSFFMVVEIIGGLYANSLAILTDAAHLLCDISGFAISLFAIWATSWESTAIQSYGFFRLEILGALVSIQFIWLITGMLLYEAIGRLYESQNAPVDGSIMLGVAMIGLFVNVCMMMLLGHGTDGSHGMHFSGSIHDHNHNHEHENVDDSRNEFNESVDDSKNDFIEKVEENHGHFDRKHSHVKGEHQHISFNEHGEHREHALVCTGRYTTLACCAKVFKLMS